MEEQKNIDVAVEKLLADHLFNPTDKPQWINKLIESDLTEEDARHTFKIAAHKYNVSKNKINDSLKPRGANVWWWLFGLLPFILIALIALGVYFASKESSSSEPYYYDEYPLEPYCGPGGSSCPK